MESVQDIPEGVNPPEYARLCVICASLIGIGEKGDCGQSESRLQSKNDSFLLFERVELNDGSNDKDREDGSANQFFKGMSILCDCLSIEQRFAEGEGWGLVGHNFVKTICCGKCLELLGDLVKLQDLILKTQATLKENVHEIEQEIVLSEGKERKSGFYLNACKQFRKEIRKGFRERNNEEVDTKPCVPFVKVEPEEWNDGAELQSESTSEDPFTNFESDNHCDERLEPEKPVQDGKRKRGRPPKRKLSEETLKPKRPRGRPRKPKSQSSEEMLGEFHCSESSGTPCSNSNEIIGKRPRGRPSKSRERPSSLRPRKSAYKAKSEKYTKQNVQSQDHLNESELKEESHGEAQGHKRRKPNSTETSSQSSTGKRVKAERDTPYTKPFLIRTDSVNMLSFLNVKVMKNVTTMTCLHPHCNFSVDYAYFSHYDAFKTIRLHIRERHRTFSKEKPSKEEDIKYYCCHHCDTQFDSRPLLVEHSKDAHPFEKPLLALCEICCDKRSLKTIQLHIIKHKNEEEKALTESKRTKRPTRSIEPLRFRCDKCDKAYNRRALLQIHSYSHVPIESREKFRCEFCSETFLSFNGLQHHINNIHLKDEQNFPHICRYCGKKFAKQLKTRYTIHLRMHTGETPYQCEQCGKSFSSNQRLNVHTRTIHVNLELQCEYCPLTFKCKKYLCKHQLKHHPDVINVKRKNGDFKEKCLRVELRADFIGPKKMYPCEPCGKIYIYKSQLTTHLMHAHKMHLERRSDYPDQLTLEQHHNP